MENETLVLTGIAASKGIGSGPVKIIKTSADFKNFNDGDVLVTKLTDPTMIMVMAKASAIVTDIGGLTSHPAIVSREMGTPCVVSTKNATAILKEGMFVKVDGTKGEVYEIK